MIEGFNAATARAEEEGAPEVFHALMPAADDCEQWFQILRTGREKAVVYEQRAITRYRLSLVREPDFPYDGDDLVRCDQPHCAARFLHQILGDSPFEVVGALLLNARHRAIGHIIPYMGTLFGADVEPRGILAPAMLANAAAVLIFHVHPSGDPEPSIEDKNLTKRMVAAGDTVGVKVVDHIILGEEPAFTSLYEREPW